MPPLADVQRRVRHAVVTGDAAGVESLLCGGRNALKRLAIHHRHYETSLVTALLGKFPATAWLVGTPFLTEAATRFVREHPPKAPCIAEYGDGFPSFLSTCPGADRLPYLRGFGELEWHLGHVAVAVRGPAVTVDDLWRFDVDGLVDARFTLQTGLRYIRASWPVDELMTLYLTETAPDRLSMDPADVRIELRGARGELHFGRLEPADFMFRSAIRDGRSFADAADRGIKSNAAFQPVAALTALVADGLVTAITSDPSGHDR